MSRRTKLAASGVVVSLQGEGPVHHIAPATGCAPRKPDLGTVWPEAKLKCFLYQLHAASVINAGTAAL